MIEVFKTNVKTKKQATQIIATLKQHFGYERVNFDLGDRDKILRIESSQVLSESVVGLLQTKNVECTALPD